MWSMTSVLPDCVIFQTSCWEYCGQVAPPGHAAGPTTLVPAHEPATSRTEEVLCATTAAPPAAAPAPATPSAIAAVWPPPTAAVAPPAAAAVATPVTAGV